jgi:hypothetical protein
MANRSGGNAGWTGWRSGSTFLRITPSTLNSSSAFRTQNQFVRHLTKLSPSPPSQPLSYPRKISPSKCEAGAASPERTAPSTEDRLESLINWLSR